ncbi:glycosyltransferase [Paenibacillus sp. KQZ6P-2]|uniref:Glycosyltransferase n=1 Tax=Paenibacillus mangrovi TaxID=2931978 RepID=A0A9X1WRS6_9BACL|nr:glycosyltransferase [Paenibacillus mangrovi]MCJ8013526.1 glycosyltransferase [Paenibacillus mangrovi]
MGHEVYYLNTISKPLMEEAILTYKPDMLFDMGWDIEHWNSDLRTEIVKQHQLFHVYFAEEDYLSYERWSKQYVTATKPDFVLTRSEDCIPKYKEMGIKAAYLDVGIVPEFHRPMPYDSRYACEVSVVDHFSYKPNVFLHKSLSDLIIPLFDQPFDTKIWGKKWNTEAVRYFGKQPPAHLLQGILPFHHTPIVYSSAKINISPQNVFDQISNRTYDILSSGAFLLTSDTPGVRDKLQVGVHCDVSGSPEETIEKISFYLKHENARQKIAKTGMLYARERFSYKNTLQKVWPEIERALQRHHSSVQKDNG